MQEDIARVLEAARAASAPTPFTSLLQAACTSAGHSPTRQAIILDVARWIADNAGVEFGPDAKA